MKERVRVFAMLVAVGLSIAVGAAEEVTDYGKAQSEEEIRVIDVVIISTNQVMLGTNTVSLVAATNIMAKHRDTLAVVAVHGSIPGAASADKKAGVMTRLAGVGVPLVIVEKDGEYAWRDPSAADGVRTVQVGTTEFGVLRRLWKRQKSPSATSSLPTVETTVTWDTATGSYELSRVQLGLFGKRVWLMHEQRESDEEPGAVGIQLRKEW